MRLQRVSLSVEAMTATYGQTNPERSAVGARPRRARESRESKI
jgi:hypothetical protein